MNPADQAQIETAKFNADMARRDARNLLTSATENAGLFVDKARQMLAQGVAVLGKTGNLGDKLNPLPSSGVGVGEGTTAEFAAEKKKYEDIIAATPQVVKDWAATHGYTGGSPAEQKALDALKAAQDSLTAMGTGGAVQDITAPDSLVYASGSDLLTMVTTRDQLERDKRTMMRSAQNEAAAMIKSGANYDKAAGYAKQAADWNTWNTILSGGLKIAGMFF